MSVVTPHLTPGTVAGDSEWHAEGMPSVAPIVNKADSILAQVIILSMWHWEAALMPCPVWEGGGEAG